MGGTMLISDEYRRLNADLHNRKIDYGTSGKRWADHIAQICATEGFQSILDYGAGKQVLEARFREKHGDAIRFSSYDPAIPAIADRKAVEDCDLVICSDVLEHVEPPALSAVIHDLNKLTRRALFFCIATRKSSHTLNDGRNAHLIIEPMEWWQAQLGQYFEIIEICLGAGEFWGLARPLLEIGSIPVKAAVSDRERAQNIRSNCAFFPNRLTPTRDGVDDNLVMPINGKSAILVCYGPSLQKTWPTIAMEAKREGGADIITCSGAYRFLMERGIKPYAHIDVDPRRHKLSQNMPIEGLETEFWLASCLHTDWQKAIPKDLARLWHAYNGEESTRAVIEADPGRGEICGGGSIGARSLSLLYFLGYRPITIHGMDCSFSDDREQHAGHHEGKKQTEIEVRLKGRRFITSPAFIAYARYFSELLPLMPGIELQLAGDGMLQTMYCAQEPAKA